MAYISTSHIARPTYYSSHNYRSSYWLGDSDHEIKENTLMTEPKGTRSSRVDRESRDKRDPEKYKRKFKIGDKVEYPKTIVRGQCKEWSRGKIVELCDNNFKKYIVRDSKTFVVYTVHEKDLKLLSDPTSITTEKIEETVKTAVKSVTIDADKLEEAAITWKNKADDVITTLKADIVSSPIKEEISSDIVVNHNTGHSICQDIDCAESKIQKLEKDIKRLKKERINQYYTNLGLICALL